jgi:7,8-dihydropterin-6-yl-methyl-4-(beta-D-ribofuranosyl)aminobenzene 5'-phosphate synthase
VEEREAIVEKEVRKTSRIDLSPVARVEITTLMDNYSDILLPSTEVVKRHPLADGQGRPREQPLAGHGFSLLIESYPEGDGEKHTVLLDAGFPVPGIEYNWRTLNVDLAGIEAVLLSHGHVDHFAALGSFLTTRGLPVLLVVHPEAFRKRALIFPDGAKADLERLASPEALAEMGAKVVLTAEPQTLVPGLISTGEVTRSTAFEKQPPITYIERDGEWVPDHFHDDQGIVAHLRGKGLVIISGCAHAGIVNTVRHAQALTGESQVHAIVGGFHLTGAPAAQVEATIDELAAMVPAFIVPAHCTGFKAQCEFAHRFPGRFVLNSVGTRIVLTA